MGKRPAWHRRLVLVEAAVTPGAYVGFLGVAAVLAVTPGPDTFLAIRFAVAGRRQGVLSATGTSVAIFAWAALAAVGVAAIVSRSSVAYTTLTICGGAYLLALGLGAMRSTTARRKSVSGGLTSRDDSARGQEGARRAFVAGVVTCLTNPKTGLFFIALFPQFAAPAASTLFVTFALGGTVAAVVYAYLLGLVVAADLSRRWLARPGVTRSIEVASGAILAALGLFMVTKALLDLAHLR